MADIEDITQHKNFEYRETAVDDLYIDILKMIQDRSASGLINATDAVGILEWAKTTIIIMNTDLGDE
jgi:hypothetical protein